MHMVPNVNLTFSLRAGSLHNCAITAIGKLICWGSNLYGQSVPRLPFKSMFDQGAVGVAAGTRNSCVIAMTGTLHCFGNNTELLNEPDKQMAN